MSLRNLNIAYRTDIDAYPLLPGSGKSRLLLPDFQAADAYQHLNAVGGRKMQLVEIAPAPPTAPAIETIDVPAVYAGPFYRHFGHFVAECIHRIWPRWTVPELRSAKLVFHCPPTRTGDRFATALNPWMVDILRVLDVAPSDLIMIDRPLHFSRLAFPDQARILGVGSVDPEYVNLFPRPLNGAGARTLGTNIYVSRRRYMYAGSYLGETLIESVLKDMGYTVVYPETEKIDDLIQTYRGAEHIVFSEGSSIHTLELCGRIDAKVFVICRRPQRMTEWIFGPLLREVASSYEMFPLASRITPLIWSPAANGPAWLRSTAMVDLEQLIQALGRFSETPIAPPSADSIKQAMQLDLLRIVLDPASPGEQTPPERLGDLLLLLRKQVAELSLLA